MKKLLLVANVAKEHICKFHLPFIQEMTAVGWQVDVACRADGEIPGCHRVIDLPCDRNPFAGGLCASVKILEREIQENRYDVVHCNTVVGSLVARLAARKFRKNGLKVFYTDHGLHFFKGAPLHRWVMGYPMERLLASATDVFIAINREDYETAKKCLPCGAFERIHGVGVNLARFRNFRADNEVFDRKEYRHSLGISENDFVVTYVAELKDNKNQLALMEAISLVQKAVPQTKLLLVGPDHTDGAFRKFAVEHGSIDTVIFTGWRNDIPQLLHTSDVYAATSKSEGLGLNIIEAMASNLPVVAFKNRGHCEIIQHQVNGFLAEQNDVEELARWILTLHNDRSLADRICAQAQKDIEKYETKAVLEESKHIYHKYLDS